MKHIRSIVFNALFLIGMLLLLLVILDKFYFVPSDEERIKKTHEEYKIREADDTAAKARKIAETIWCENRSSRKSMDLVMSVIYERAKEKTLDGLYAEVIKRKQFSCLNSEEIMASQTLRQRDKEMLAWAHQIVWRFMAGSWKQTVKAKFYYAPAKVEKPKYLEDKKLVLAYEGHHFYY